MEGCLPGNCKGCRVFYLCIFVVIKVTLMEQFIQAQNEYIKFLQEQLNKKGSPVLTGDDYDRDLILRKRISELGYNHKAHMVNNVDEPEPSQTTMLHQGMGTERKSDLVGWVGCIVAVLAVWVSLFSVNDPSLFMVMPPAMLTLILVSVWLISIRGRKGVHGISLGSKANMKQAGYNHTKAPPPEPVPNSNMYGKEFVNGRWVTPKPSSSESAYQ